MIHQIITDQSSVQTTSVSPQNNEGDIAYGNYQLMAKLGRSALDTRCATPGILDSMLGDNHCAKWCSNTGQKLNGHNTNTQRTIGTDDYLCGNVLTITGMLQTYDELHLRQFGTIQEIWVQLMFAYSHTTVYAADADDDNKMKATHGFESPFPNVFFSAPQVTSVIGTCSSSLDPYAKCNGYTRAENLPFAGTDTDANRWNQDVDGAGSDRGDSFWVDDWDA